MNFMKMAGQMVNSKSERCEEYKDQQEYDIKKILEENSKAYKELRSKRVK